MLVQQKPQAGVYGVHTAEDAETKLGKRGDKMDEPWVELFGDGDPESRFPATGGASSRTPVVELSVIEDPLICRRTSSNRYLSPKNYRKWLARAMYRRAQAMSRTSCGLTSMATIFPTKR